MWIAGLARIVAVLALVAGVLRAGTGLLIAMNVIGPYHEALARYAPGSASSGDAINDGLYAILIGLALGTLAEIALKK
ncbi:hypothetical protein [Ensifer sp. ENS08]|uniref:hypothetical protein n=1 Tax=Ensifer sp. ENS08 TaxID=2769273 RepID=UPI001782286B|nr:hypothetical protein [Ensifer sp. ENS08]MBD9569016.1 hypothetical protein [Ensifer sp. ENS08]